ncbi:VOC family protein [Sphingomonas sp. LM7]|uniref:VOC family protein n=1 Tax=Sphingomonas sp. LM7 TaxID=1938607 RepID=UPI000983C91A|nr:VOC family protein [Sphingomonas sp. LM7]AQR73256.1 glyoxalase/bleomycin resistance/extradiol dioxygenase family protein [Sphingomonas sp. LM7]
MAKLNYVELPVKAVAGVRDFYAQAFGWSFIDYGPAYAASSGGDVALGLNGSSEEDAIPAILPLVEVEDLEAALADVIAAGGEVVVPIFGFPGGRRFHFRDPGGNVLGVFVNEPE